MELTWTNILLSLLPIVAGIIGAFMNDYVNNAVQDVKIANLETKLSHLSNNKRQKDEILFGELKEIKEEVKHLSIAIAELKSKR